MTDDALTDLGDELVRILLFCVYGKRDSVRKLARYGLL